MSMRGKELPRLVVLPLYVAAIFSIFLVSSAVARAEFGIIPGSFKVTALNRDGTIDTRAGSHPYELVVHFEFNLNAQRKADGNVRDIEVDLPPGLVGNPTAVPRCSRSEFEGEVPQCSGSTQVGLLHFEIENAGEGEGAVYDVASAHGQAATLGFSSASYNVFENASVRTGSDYAVTVHTNNIPVDGLAWATETIWGVPADPSHDHERFCHGSGGEFEIIIGCPSAAALNPFLTMPTSCGTPTRSEIYVDSRENPSELLTSEPGLSMDADGNPRGLTGCELVSFEPGLKLAPDTGAADTPAGLTAEVKVGQAGLEAPNGLSAADVKNTVVTLPEGVAINPGQAAGLEACPYSKDGVGTEGPPDCPNASKVGTVSVKTPLLEEQLEGNVYVLPANPPNLEVLVAPAAPDAGIYLKLIGKIHLDEGTGQITTTFAETPQLPFTKFRLSFSGGAQAALSTPVQCGVYTSRTDFTPWGTPFQADDLTTDSFAITSGTGGAPCPSNPLPFEPTMSNGKPTRRAPLP